MSIIALCDAVEMKKLIKDTVKLKGPLYVSARGGEKIISRENDKINFGKARLKKT